MGDFSHVDDGSVEMVDVGGKDAVFREAAARGEIRLRRETLEAVEADEVEKGSVENTARIAAIQAVKETWQDIPLCHPLPVEGVDVEFSVGDEGVEMEVVVRSTGVTGVEMEALNGVTRGLLTVWDMVKSMEKDGDGQYPGTEITGVRVVRKVKGGEPRD